MPAVVQKYVKTGKLKMELRLLTFLGDDSVTGGRALEAAGLQNRLWDAADLFYKNQGEENSGYVTEDFLKRVLGGVPGLNVSKALSDASTNGKVAQALGETKTLASRYGVDSTPTAVIGPTNGTLNKDPEQTLTASGIGQMVEAALKQAK
jgi:protein-disulfide isomerase